MLLQRYSKRVVFGTSDRIYCVKANSRRADVRNFTALICNEEENRTFFFKSMFRMESIRNRADLRCEMRVEGLVPDKWKVIEVREG